MAEQIIAHRPTGETIYATVFHPTIANTIRDVVAGAWDTIATGDWGTYDIAMTDASTAGIYSAAEPSGLVIALPHAFIVYKQLGGSPASTDLAVAAGELKKVGAVAGMIINGTVDSGSFTPTTTAFEADDITDTAADFYNSRILLFTSGALLGQATRISDYSKQGSNGRFTISAVTSAPADNVTFIIA